jgi:SulP family sulfate permease
MASVGLTEGLLTINLVDEITGTRGTVENVLPRKCHILNGFFLRNGRVSHDSTDFG